MEINRTFSHRKFGAIGSVALVVPDGEWTLEGKTLPDASVAYLAAFALQSLQDAYAGSENADAAIAAFNGKRNKLIEGTIGTRGSGDGADERTRVARSVVRKAVKAKFGAKSPEWAKFTGLDDAAQNAKLDEWYAGNEKAFGPEVDAEMARRAEAAKAKDGLAKKLSIEI